MMGTAVLTLPLHTGRLTQWTGLGTEQFALLPSLGLGGSLPIEQAITVGLTLVPGSPSYQLFSFQPVCLKTYCVCTYVSCCVHAEMSRLCFRVP